MPTLIEQARAIRAQAAPASALTLAQFAGSGRTIRLYSAVLGQQVLLAADNAHVDEDETHTVYRARELGLLLGSSPEGLRLLHEVKRCFGGEIKPENLNKPE